MNKTQAKPAVPAATKAAVAAQNAAPADSTSAEAPVAKKKGEKGREFTYIGAGDSSPYVITLMGKQKFVRGQLTEVTDPDLLAKLPGMSTFVEGPADAETLHKIDQEGKEHYDAQRKADEVANAKFVKKHHGE